MAKSLEDEIKLTLTFRCPKCEQDFLANGEPRCPDCGKTGYKPRISSREKSITSYIYRYLPNTLVHLVNLPLIREIVTTAKQLDFEPTRENADFPIQQLVLDSMEYFSEHYNLPSRKGLVHDGFKILFTKLSDPHYRMLFEKWILFMAKRIEETDFKPSPIPRGEQDHWKEPMEVMV